MCDVLFTFRPVSLSPLKAIVFRAQATKISLCGLSETGTRSYQERLAGLITCKPFKVFYSVKLNLERENCYIF